MESILTILATLFIITILVFVHELGHFLAAKFFKVNVKEFAIGFGKKLFSKDFRGTNYSIRMLPLGGFVDLEGETQSIDENSFRNKRAYQKVIILSAGVLMNILFAIITFTVFLPINNFQFTLPAITTYQFNNTEDQITAYPLYVTEVVEGGNSEGELEEGEVIIGLNNIRFASYSEFQKIIEDNKNSTINVEFLDLENLKTTSRDLTIEEANEDGSILNVRLFELNRSSASSSYPAYFIKYPNSVLSGANLALDLTVFVPKALISIIQNSFATGNLTELGNSVGGPLQIIDNSNQIVEAGVIEAFIPLAGLLSISLAIFNILPFPALDGGQIFVVILEKVMRRKIPDSTLEKINLFGFIFLFGLAGILTLKDFLQLNVIDKIVGLFG